MRETSALLAILLLHGSVMACRSVAVPAGPVAVAPEPAGGAGETSAQPIALPATCVAFLSRLQCWLGHSGNDPSTVDQAVGVARATFELRTPRAPVDDSAARCSRAASFLHDAFARTDCEDVAIDPSALAPAVSVECAAGEHFFIRRDGRVAGCRADCTTDADCPEGSRCVSIGSSPGGPIEEPFCE